MRIAIFLVGLYLASLVQCRGETLVTDSKILEVTERGFILAIGTEPLAVEDSVSTHFWKDFGDSKRTAFAVGDPVHVRIKTDSDPPALREMSDPATSKWLDKIRSDYVRGTIEKMDAKYLVLKLEDGRLFAYRATDKSAVKLKDKPDATIATLEKGMAVWAKGRLLSTLDTWLFEIRDEPPPASSKAAPKGKKAPKLEALPASGVLEGTVMAHLVNLKMFDIVAGVRALHISYNSKTAFSLDGHAAKSADLRQMQKCRIEYRRDKAGRLIASKVELFSTRS